MLSILVSGLQVEYAVCLRHSTWKERAEARIKAVKQLKRLEKAHRRGKTFSEETCLLCGGTRRVANEECWHCKGRGKVFAGIQCTIKG